MTVFDRPYDDPVRVLDEDGTVVGDLPEVDEETLVEAVQYRFGAHTTADNPTIYRDDNEVERWRRKDPIPRLEAFLRSEGVLDDERVAEIESAVETRVADAIEAAESTARPRPRELFEHAYAEVPAELERQYDELAALRESRGDAAFLEE